MRLTIIVDCIIERPSTYCLRVRFDLSTSKRDS